MTRVGRQAGFTIMETIIFLAVSAALFASAILLIGGQQQKTQFNAAVRDLDNKIQAVLGNVATGYYNSTSNTFCENHAGVPVPSQSGGRQGTNGDCTFLGQTIVPPASGGDMTIYSIVGLRVAGSQEVDTFNEAKPQLFTDTKETYTLNGADFGYIEYKQNATDPSYTRSAYSLVFVTSFVKYEGTTDPKLQSGSTNTSILLVDSYDTADIGNLLSTGGDAGSSSVIKNPASIQLCITDGARQGIIELKGASTQSTISPGGCS